MTFLVGFTTGSRRAKATHGSYFDIHGQYLIAKLANKKPRCKNLHPWYGSNQAISTEVDGRAVGRADVMLFGCTNERMFSARTLVGTGESTSVTG